MRIFAGPNGSGKSTLKSVIKPALLGVYINADDIEQTIRLEGALDLSQFTVDSTADHAVEFLKSSPLLQKSGVDDLSTVGVKTSGTMLMVDSEEVNAYIAAAIAGFLREELLRLRISFTFETVMSSPDKVDLMRRAREAGFRVYLYYIATADPEINSSRVQSRVNSGGHDVPEDKIVSRYYRSLDLLYDAIRNSNRAYVFDNSTEEKEKVWLAEMTDGGQLTLNSDEVPEWFGRYVIDKAQGGSRS